MLNLDLSNIASFVPADFLTSRREALEQAAAMIWNHTGPGGDFTGWVDLPKNYNQEEFARIQAAARKIQRQSQVLVVIGIGGSYLGARAVIDLLRSPNYNLKKKDTPDIFFVGNGLSTDYMLEIMELIGDRDFSVNVISKSGTTTEPAVAFRIFKGMLEKKYGKEGARERIYATTDKAKGALRGLAEAEGYETFVVPDDIGGRFSCLSAVGLLPMAAGGMDIGQVMMGCLDACERYQNPELLQNDSMLYAAARFLMLMKGKKVEVLVGYEPALVQFGEWYKQLMAESEGKEGKGLFPVSAGFTTDLHSIGQFIQDGSRTLFETVLWVEQARREITVPADPGNVDGLDFAAGMTLQTMNEKAMKGTLLAHVDGGAPNLVITLNELSDYTFGELVYFFWKSLAVSGYMIGVNPFDQPGVEAYKKNMFALLGKPGYESAREALEKRLESLH